MITFSSIERYAHARAHARTPLHAAIKLEFQESVLDIHGERVPCAAMPTDYAAWQSITPSLCITRFSQVLVTFQH